MAKKRGRQATLSDNDQRKIYNVLYGHGCAPVDNLAYCLLLVFLLYRCQRHGIISKNREHDHFTLDLPKILILYFDNLEISGFRRINTNSTFCLYTNNFSRSITALSHIELALLEVHGVGAEGIAKPVLLLRAIKHSEKIKSNARRKEAFAKLLSEQGRIVESQVTSISGYRRIRHIIKASHRFAYMASDSQCLASLFNRNLMCSIDGEMRLTSGLAQSERELPQRLFMAWRDLLYIVFRSELGPEKISPDRMARLFPVPPFEDYFLACFTGHGAWKVSD